MILTKYVSVNISARTVGIYRRLGYSCSVGDVVNIDVIHISPNSHQKIEVCCDFCSVIKTLRVYSYWKSYNNHKLYCCKKCTIEKCKLTMLDRYGVEYPLQSTEIMSKMIDTNMSRYGVKNVMILDKFKQKSVENCFIKHGVYYPPQSPVIMSKLIATNLERYGVKYVFELEEFKAKSRSTNLDRYGSEYYLSSDIAKKVIRSVNESNDYWSYDIDGFSKYKNRVNNLTSKNKKSLFENWNGYDYYDDEYIECYLYKGNHLSGDYPTIDHKLSILFGFNNDVTPSDMSKLSNLCVTKKSINSTKGSKCHDEFLKYLGK